MLKKTCAVAIIILILAAVTAGSVSPVKIASGSKTVFAYKYTTVILDLSGQQKDALKNNVQYATGYVTTGTTVSGAAGYVSANSTIGGNIIVQLKGANASQVFPVQFVKSAVTGNATGQVVNTYNADVSYYLINGSAGISSGFAMSSMDSHNSTISTSYGDSRMSSTLVSYASADPAISEEAYFTFTGKINVTELDAEPVVPVVTEDEQYDNEIKGGQTLWNQAQVSGGSTSLNVDLKWQNPQDDLRLMVYGPNGQVLGPYEDNSDGRPDGQIYMELDNPKGIADGTWSFKVTDTSATGSNRYSIRTW
jgi:hypothetical protein